MLVRLVAPLRYDAFEPELAGVLEHEPASNSAFLSAATSLQSLVQNSSQSDTATLKLTFYG
jgi:hypothetical protein